jgi:Flp pilus assembly pilin Flp
MHSLTSRFLRDESGATATEYAMLLVFVALGIALAAQTFGTNMARPVHTRRYYP